MGTFKVARRGRDSVAELARAVVGKIIDVGEGRGIARRRIIASKDPYADADDGAPEDDPLP